jgi:hypothetical protein
MNLKLAFRRFRDVRRKVRWFPILTGAALVVLHFIIEMNYVSYWPSPQERSPWLIRIMFRELFLATFLLGLFIFPRWQSFVAFTSLAFVILSVSGR